MERNLRKSAADKSNKWEHKFCDDNNDYQGSATTDGDEGHHGLEKVTEEIILLESNFSSQPPVCEVSFGFDFFLKKYAWTRK